MQQFFLTVVFQNFQTRKLNSSALTEFIFEKDNFLNFLGVESSRLPEALLLRFPAVDYVSVFEIISVIGSER